MDKNKKTAGKAAAPAGAELVEQVWEKGWTYIKSVVDVVHEPVLILDKSFRVMAANEPFYRTFQVEQNDTEKKVVYDLGNGQWDIPALRKLLEDILPKNTFFRGFEVIHTFPSIGRKIMILNARQIYFKEATPGEPFPPIILLAMEDVTDIMNLAETLAEQKNRREAKMAERTETLEVQIAKLAREMDMLKKKA